ncbi:DinB family protein [Phytoactinopolyspora limicola]|uniref:DinB family protein n=1 Tax=Phytoactinopolyspora limicola TaxID=2715536 RepID=UPI003CCDBCEE
MRSTISTGTTAFGPAELDFDLEMPGNAADARAWLRESREPVSQEFRRLTNADLDELRLTNWGERRSTDWLLTTLIREQDHHGAEISLLRDLYRNRHTLRSQPVSGGRV